MGSLNFPDDFERVHILTDLKNRIDAYAEHYRTDSFIVHEVETVHKARLFKDMAYGLKLDLLIELTSGEFKGDLIVMDHKFVYNFKTDKELNMDGQLPKYIMALRVNGIVVTKAIFNQIRYRSIKDAQPKDLYNRTWARTSLTQRTTIWSEQVDTATEILNRGLSPLYTPRTMSVLTCRSCYFEPICNTELHGGDVTHLIATQYQPTTYGYTDLQGDS